MADKTTIQISENEGLDWEGGGYLHRIKGADNLVLSQNIADNPLETFTVILNQAKRGDFSNLMLLFEVREAADYQNDNRLSYLSFLLLGEAGTQACYNRMIRIIKEVPIDYELVLDCCNALSMRGRLADVPLLLEAYRNYVSVKDMDIIPVWLSEVLEYDPAEICDEANKDNFDDYATIVMKHYRACVKEYGSDQMMLIKGQPYTLNNLGKIILEKLKEPDDLSSLRRHFEAASGIDCSSFYIDGVIQPLNVAATVEQFIEDMQDHVDINENRRYFFRHPLKD